MREVVYVSALLAKHQTAFGNLTSACESRGIGVGALNGTKDIWARDYMPIETSPCEYVQFRYEPSYLKEERHLQTPPNTVQPNPSTMGRVTASDLKLDGGNCVGDGNGTYIVTDRVFSENKALSKNAVKDELRNKLKATKLVIIPAEPLDFTGHSDGLVKHYGGNQWLVGEEPYSKKKLNKELDKIFKENGLEKIDFPYAPSDIIHNGETTAIGCYINFVELRHAKAVLLPQFGIKDDARALAATKQLYPQHAVFPIQCRDIAMEGGALNCVTWNVRFPQ